MQPPDSSLPFPAQPRFGSGIPRCAASVTIGVLVAVGLACSRVQPGAAPAVPVRVSVVERIQVGNAAKYSASIAPNAQMDLAFKSGGYVASIRQVAGADGRIHPLDVGDSVKEGTVLAEVRKDEYQDRILQAKADLAKAAAGYEQAKLSFERASHLFASGSATKPEYEQAQAQFEAATSTVEAAKAQLSLANTQLADSILKAPRDGWITKRNVEVGSLVSPAIPAFTLVDTHLVRAAFGVPDTAIQSVRLGQRLRVTAEAADREFEGRVTSISPAADARNRVFSVEVTLANPAGKLKAGMVAALTLGASHAHEAVVVPLAAVLRSAQDANGFTVMVAESSSRGLVARSRVVQLGDAYGNDIAVAGGLQAGERVITTGAPLVRDGDRIELLP